MLLDKLYDQGLITPPKFLIPNTQLLVMMGSVAYGVSSDTSDVDLYGFTIPYRDDIFPHLRGELIGFGTQKQRFEQWQEHHVKTQDGKKEYDFSIYSIVKYFQLCLENNPNMIDSMWVPQRCVMHCTAVGQMVRDSRAIFLHKGSFHKFRGYAFAQMAKIRSKTSSKNEKRAADIESFGYSTKFAYHVVRLALEAEMILTEHRLDLEANSEILKSIRRGEWKLEDIEQWFTDKELALENLYATSTLQHSPDEGQIKNLLMNCLEHHYGDLSSAIAREPSTDLIIRDLEEIIARYKGRAK